MTLIEGRTDVMNEQEVRVMLEFIVAAIREEVKDPEVLERLRRRLVSVLGPQEVVLCEERVRTLDLDAIAENEQELTPEEQAEQLMDVLSGIAETLERLMALQEAEAKLEEEAEAQRRTRLG